MPSIPCSIKGRKALIKNIEGIEDSLNISGILSTKKLRYRYTPIKNIGTTAITTTNK